MSSPNWTTSELALLKESYSRLNISDLVAALPRHTIDSIRMKASRLGLRKRRNWRMITAQHKPAFNLWTGAVK